MNNSTKFPSYILLQTEEIYSFFYVAIFRNVYGTECYKPIKLGLTNLPSTLNGSSKTEHILQIEMDDYILYLHHFTVT